MRAREGASAALTDVVEDDGQAVAGEIVEIGATARFRRLLPASGKSFKELQ